MKKIVLVLLSCIFLAGCSGETNHAADQEAATEEPAVTVTEDGTRITTSLNQDTYDLKSLPYDMRYNEKTITFAGVDFYQEKFKHAYIPYAVMKLDLSQLNEDELYWLQEDMQISCFLTQEKNDIDFAGLPQLCSYEDEGYQYYVFEKSDDKYRYDFRNAMITFNVNITQEEKIEETERTEHKRYLYSYEWTLETYLKDCNKDTDEVLRHKIGDALGERVYS